MQDMIKLYVEYVLCMYFINYHVTGPTEYK